MRIFRIAIVGDLLRPDGSFAFPDYSLLPLTEKPNVELKRIECGPILRGESLEDVDALISVPMGGAITSHSFPSSGRLSAIVRLGVGYEDVDVEACTANDVGLFIPSEVTRRPTAVAALTLLLALATRLIDKHALTIAGPDDWNRRADLRGLDLTGKTLGLIGLGSIGAELVRLCRPLDLKFLAFDPVLSPERATAIDVELTSLELLLREADFVSIHCPLTPSTRHLLNGERLVLMKPSAFLINTARGGIVDQRALTEALQQRRLAGAGLDVFAQEPPDPADPLFKLPNVVFSAHALNWTIDLDIQFGRSNARCLEDLMRGRVPTGLVNPAVLSSDGWRLKLAGYERQFGSIEQRTAPLERIP